MQRRQFLSRTLAASTAALTATAAGASAIAPTTDDAEDSWPIDEDSDAYRELFYTVHRDEQYADPNPRSSRNYKTEPVSDQIHRLKVLALLSACEWAEAAGIVFRWQ